jgi:DNA-binding PadR family transcriptional regulator
MARSSDPTRFLPLSPHAFQILLSLLDRDLHGYSLIKDVEDRTGGEMVLGTSTAYSAIKRMVEDGLLEDADPPPAEPSGGPRRRYYRITDLGRRVARAEGLRIRRLQEMVAGTSLLDDGEAPLPGEAKP